MNTITPVKSVGFTGTQQGMTISQMKAVMRLLSDLHTPFDYGEFHHGDCVGADVQANDIAANHNFTIIIHPPTNAAKRAYTSDAEKIMPCKDYLVRNHDIVDASDVLIATPKESTEQLRSGTWATVRYARKCGKLVYIVFPDGGAVKYNK